MYKILKYFSILNDRRKYKKLLKTTIEREKYVNFLSNEIVLLENKLNTELPKEIERLKFEKQVAESELKELNNLSIVKRKSVMDKEITFMLN